MKTKRLNKEQIGIYILNFFKWIVLAGITGAVGGLVGSVFHIAVEYVTELRAEHSYIIYFMPAGGLLIALLYKVLKMEHNRGTDHVIIAVREKEKVPLALTPAIFIGTVITHLVGGSAGREGAALQLGGSIGSQIGSLFKLNEKDMHLIIMCGMSGVFSAVFGTPLTATVFVMEVSYVGTFYYSALIPNLTSALVAFGISSLFGISPVRFNLDILTELNIMNIGKVTVLAAVCALVSIAFCILMHTTHKYAHKWIKNSYLRILTGGVIIVILTLIVGDTTYNGAGMSIIENAIAGNAVRYAFLLKMVFTAVTISTGYRGGEIIPTMFIGATLGCTVGPLLGLPASLSAAIGLVALFCGVVNCPIASIILSIELFGSEGLLFFAVACAVSYVLSGYYSLYGTQKIMYSKVEAELIDRETC